MDYCLWPPHIFEQAFKAHPLLDKLSLNGTNVIDDTIAAAFNKLLNLKVSHTVEFYLYAVGVDDEHCYYVVPFTGGLQGPSERDLLLSQCAQDIDREGAWSREARPLWLQESQSYFRSFSHAFYSAFLRLF